MDDVKKAYVWQEAIELSKQLATVCEEFRDPETNVLVWHLRQAIIDIPAGIAADLQNSRVATKEPMIKLATALELVRRIYPGIETSDAEEQFEKLWQRMSGGSFAEREPEPREEGDENEALSPSEPDNVPPSKVKVDGVSQAAAVETTSSPEGDSPKDQE